VTTYRTTSWQAAPGQLLPGAGPNGEPVFLTLLGSADGFEASSLDSVRLPRPADSPLLAPLIDLGTAASSIFAVEPRVRAWPLEAVLEKARLKGAALSPEACAWIAARLCEAVASLGAAGHRGLSLRTIQLQASGEPYVLGSAYGHLLEAALDVGPLREPGSEARGTPEQRHADAAAIARLARQLATCGSTQADDWGSLPLSLKAPLAHAADGTLSPAALGQQLVSALEAWGRSPSSRTVEAWLAELELPEAEPLDASSPTRELEPAGPFAASFGEGVPALRRDGRLDQPACSLQVEPLAVDTSAMPPAQSAPAEPLELDEKALAHAFGPAPAPLAAKPRAPRRWGRAAAMIAGALVLFALAAGLWAFGAPAALRALRAPDPVRAALAPSESQHERPRGSYGTAILRIESIRQTQP
jgi:hypothetical protein